MLGKTNVKVKPNKSTILEFVSSIAPTTWEVVTTGTEYTAYNEYGKWRIWADNFRGDTYEANKSFDGDNSSYWSYPNQSDETIPIYIEIELPKGIAIKPEKIEMTQQYITTSSKILGLNQKTKTWENLIELVATSTSKQTKIYEIDTDNFYTAFKLELYRYSSSYRYNRIYEFQITSGLVKTGGGVW